MRPPLLALLVILALLFGVGTRASGGELAVPLAAELVAEVEEAVDAEAVMPVGTVAARPAPPRIARVPVTSAPGGHAHARRVFRPPRVTAG